MSDTFEMTTRNAEIKIFRRPIGDWMTWLNTSDRLFPARGGPYGSKIAALQALTAAARRTADSAVIASGKRRAEGWRDTHLQLAAALERERAGSGP